MTKYPAVLSTCLALSACASSPPFSADHRETPQSSGATAAVDGRSVDAEPSPSPSASASDHDVKVAQDLDIKDYDRRLVCRREAPLGTRIAHRLCFTPGEEGPSSTEAYLQRQEFERLRDQQANLELLREEALRQSTQQSPQRR